MKSRDAKALVRQAVKAGLLRRGRRSDTAALLRRRHALYMRRWRKRRSEYFDSLQLKLFQ
jgi:hypothetical protein